MLNETATATKLEGDLLPDRQGFPDLENFIEVGAPQAQRQVTFEEIKAACAKCRDFGGEEGFFNSRLDDHITEVKQTSYEMLQLVNGDSDRLNVAIRHSGVKTTKATLKNEALIWLKITAKPRDTVEMKLCSSWAEVLNEARAKNIPVEEFSVWAKTRNKQRPRAIGANRRAEPSSTKDTNQLKLRLTGSDGPVNEILALPPLVHAELLDVLRTRCPQSERVQRLANSLLVLADQLKMAEEAATALSPATAEPDASPVVTAEGVDE